MKKLVSLVLAVMMLLSVASVAGAEDVISITWAMGTGGTAPVDNALVLEELNKIAREKIGVECQIDYFTNDQIQISIQSGEVYDIYYTCSWYNNTTQGIGQGLYLDVAEAVKTVTPGLYASMTQDVWDLATHPSGAIYAIPVKKDYAAINMIYYPSDIAAELGFEMPDRIAAWDELTPFLTAWKETLPEGEYPVNIGGQPAGMESSFDFIDRTAMIGCVFGTTEVCTVFDDPAIMERYRTMAKWYDMGLVNPDVAQLTENAIDNSKPRINFVQAWPGYDYSVANGYPTKLITYSGPNLNVDGVQGSMNALSIALEDDTAKRDACLKYLELSYIDREFNDIMRFGVPGLHFNYVTEEQNPACAGGVLRTDLGSENYNPWGFSQPAYFNTSIPVSQKMIDGTEPAPVLNQYDLYYKMIEEEGVASAMGSFLWDTSDWQDALAEMSAIKDEYYSDFASGTRSIDEVYDEFIEKMNAAGLQDMIADAQAELDAFLGK